MNTFLVLSTLFLATVLSAGFARSEAVDVGAARRLLAGLQDTTRPNFRKNTCNGGSLPKDVSQFICDFQKTDAQIIQYIQTMITGATQVSSGSPDSSVPPNVASQVLLSMPDFTDVNQSAHPSVCGTDCYALPANEQGSEFIGCLNGNMPNCRATSYNTDAVVGIFIYGPKFPKVNDYAFASFPNLHTLFMSNGSIKEIGVNAFVNLKNLKNLYLGGNKLETFSLQTLAPVNRLTVLSLENNSIACSGLCNVDYALSYNITAVLGKCAVNKTRKEDMQSVLSGCNVRKPGQSAFTEASSSNAGLIAGVVVAVCVVAVVAVVAIRRRQLTRPRGIAHYEATVGSECGQKMVNNGSELYAADQDYNKQSHYENA